jgi:hypothetical protein
MQLLVIQFIIKIIINYNYNQYSYRWTPVSAGDMFQDLLWSRETADNTERYNVIFV